MKKVLYIISVSLIVLLTGCVGFTVSQTGNVTETAEPEPAQTVSIEPKLALDNYESFADDKAFASAVLDDLNNAAQESGETYEELILKYSKDSTMTAAVKEELRRLFEDEAADSIRRLDAYNILIQCDSKELQESALLSEELLLADDVISSSINNNKEGEVLKYYCVFWHHWDKERYGLPLTPYTTLSALSGIPRDNLASAAEKADRIIVCDVTYLKSRDYSIYGFGDSVTEGYSSEVRIYIQNRHTGETEAVGELSYGPPISFEAYAPPKYVFGEIDYNEINNNIAAYFSEL